MVSTGLLDGLRWHQSQLALGTVRARAFCAIFTFPVVLAQLQREEERGGRGGGSNASSLWGIVRQAAGMVARQGVHEGRYLCCSMAVGAVC